MYIELDRLRWISQVPEKRGSDEKWFLTLVFGDDENMIVHDCRWGVGKRDIVEYLL